VRVLVIGGTGFLGRNFVEESLTAGHEVTLFNRGQTNPGIFLEVEQLRGDRERDLSPLEGREWDAVFDPSCYLPRVARMSAKMLAKTTPRYALVSSISVYADFPAPGQDESAPLETLEDPTDEDVEEHYGALKALCEREVQAAYSDRALIIRAGFIVGAYDDVDRLPYWIRRIARGGEVLTPVSADYPAQMIDARDIASWTLQMFDQDLGGVFNVAGPQPPYRLGEVFETIRRVTGSDATFTWVPEDFLIENGVKAWDGLPYWLGSGRFVAQIDVSKALVAGLELRPLEETVRDTFVWDQTRGDDSPLRCGIPARREADLLRAWHMR
jgi:2'-hydroxyisoflavone reductase